MHAWWIRAFRSAYGSASGAGAVAPFPFGTTVSAAPFSPWRDRRSWSPIGRSAPRQAERAALPLRRRLFLGHDGLGQLAERLCVVRSGVGQDGRRAAVDG